MISDQPTHGTGFADRGATAVQWYRVQHGSATTPHRPIRMCIGCRQRELSIDLLRVVATECVSGDGTRSISVVPDIRGRLPGRGAWLHPVSACLAAAVRRRAIGAALRVSGNLDISALEHHLENRHEHS